MKTKLFILLLLLAASPVGYAQNIFDPVVSYQSFTGTYDLSQNPERAQFAGNNKLLRVYMADFQDFCKVSKLYVVRDSHGFPQFIYKDLNLTVELRFFVHPDGQVGNMEVVTPTSKPDYDLKVKTVLESTSGKWRPGTVNGVAVGEFVTMWVHLYHGYQKEKDYQQYMDEGDACFAKNDYENAIEAYGKVLFYDELNTRAAAQKGLALVKVGKSKKACKIWHEHVKYGSEEIRAAMAGNCPHAVSVSTSGIMSVE